MTTVTMAKKILVVAAMTGATLAGTAGIASAGSANGGCALSMLHDATMGSGPMVHNAVHGNGDAGMFHAVDVSGC